MGPNSCRLCPVHYKELRHRGICRGHKGLLIGDTLGTSQEKRGTLHEVERQPPSACPPHGFTKGYFVTLELFLLDIMTLLGNEHSLLIRSKFRSVLQLRLQQRRNQERLGPQCLKSSLKTPVAFLEHRKNLERAKTEDCLKHKVKPRAEKPDLPNMHVIEDFQLPLCNLLLDVFTLPPTQSVQNCASF
ncbi:uncharacterized protein LOC128656548 [Bombina bombina]|uniref:uncharacterized protein LOC128656548 n=1 Tax=Bombina bombina TaxID=8345 RepID=UPI00235A7BD4|nr:uncharacterized protein LOC128656548 [Bombina bombina]